MFKEKDIINADEIDEEECSICKTHETAYKFFNNLFKKELDNEWSDNKSSFCNDNQIFSEEEMIDKSILCPICNKPMTKGYSSYDRAVVTWDNGTNSEGDVGYYHIYECKHCKKPFAMMPTEVHYNANHDIFYTGGKYFLSYSDEEILKEKIKDKMLSSIEQYTRRIKAGESGIDSWNLNVWLQGDIEHAIAEFLYEAGYKK